MYNKEWTGISGKINYMQCVFHVCHHNINTRLADRKPAVLRSSPYRPITRQDKWYYCSVDAEFEICHSPMGKTDKVNSWDLVLHIKYSMLLLQYTPNSVYDHVCHLFLTLLILGLKASSLPALSVAHIFQCYKCQNLLLRLLQCLWR